MSSSSRLTQIVEGHPRTFAEQAGITLKDTPSPLFRLLVLTALLSANLDPRLGLRAARALATAGYTTAAHMAEAGDRALWQVLSESKYLRKEQTARQLGELGAQCQERYGGDLRGLREETGGEVAAMEEVLAELTGIGPIGVGIFLREVQAVWDGIRPYADQRVLDLAEARGLPHTAVGLARAAGTDDLSRAGAALVQADAEDRRG